MKFRGRSAQKRAGGLALCDSGYTVLEVLLFIAMSSFLLIVAVSNISGNQRRVQFSQGVRDFESELNDILNDVPTGFFPTNSTLSCTASVSGPVIGDGGNAGLGQNAQCVYVGKALQFAPDGNQSTVLIYSLAGLRVTSTGDPVRTVDEAQPVAIANPADPTFDDSTVVLPLRNGIRVSRVFNADVTPVTTDSSYGTVAVLTNFEGTTPTGEAANESQTVQIGGILGTTLSQTKQNAVTLINDLQTTNGGIDGQFITPADGIIICLNDEAGRKASVTLGGSVGTSGTKLDIDTYDTRCD